MLTVSVFYSQKPNLDFLTYNNVFMPRKIALILTIISYILPMNGQTFEKVPGIDLQLGIRGFGSWCDYNSDGYLDIFITGIESETFSYARLYKNNGDQSFSEVFTDYFPNVIDGNISWGDYDNNGTPDMIYAGWSVGSGDIKFTKIYKNIDNERFSEVQHNIPALYVCYIEWVDVNNDGLLDIYFQGFDSADQFQTGIYKNVSNDEFELIQTRISPITGSRGNYTKNTAIWVDLDNDGYKDLVSAKSSSQDYNLLIYKNCGDFQFTEIDTILPSLNYVSIATGDLNSDGYMDLVIAGSTESVLYSPDAGADMYIYMNYGNFNLKKEYTISNVGAFSNNLEIGDIDNDGYPDLLYYGGGSSYNLLRIYLNNVGESYISSDHNIINSQGGGVALADFDNDNDLDILQYGKSSSTYIGDSYVFENKSENQNQLPVAPENIEILAIENDIQISWNEGNDDLTSPESLYYNLRIGTKTNPDSILSTSSLNGKLRYMESGNQNLNNSYFLKTFSEGNFSVSLQSIDNAFNASYYSDTMDFCFQHTQNIFPDTIVICETDSFLLDAGGTGEIFLWNNGKTDSSIYADEEGFYNVNIVDSGGCLRSETTYLKFTDSLKLNLGDNIEICENDTVDLNILPYNRIQWSTGQTRPEISVSESGTYWVNIEDQHQCYIADTISIMVHPNPYINLGADTVLHQNDTLVLMGNKEYTTITWNDSIYCDSVIIQGNNFSEETLTFWVEVRNQYNCLSGDTINISVRIPENNPSLNITPEIKVYPTIVHDKFFVEFNERLNHDLYLHAYNLSGYRVYSEILNNSERIHEIEISNPTSGYYIVSITDGHKYMYSKKIFIE